MLIALAGCGAPAPGERLDLDPLAALCHTATNRVLDLQPLPGGEVWAATEGGLLRFAADGTLLEKRTRSDGLAGHALKGLALAPDGALWIASGDGVSRLRDGRIDRFTTADGLNDDRCYGVAIGPEGFVYVATERGVARFDGERFAPFADTHEFSRRPTYAIHAAADGTLWIAKENALTRWLGGSDWQVFQRDPLIPGPRARIVSNSVRAVATDAEGRPWIGTHHRLGHLADEGWRRLAFAERLFAGSGPLDNHVATVAVDDAGGVWIGHGDSRDFEGGVGAARFDDDGWDYFTVADGLPDNRVHRIRVAEDGAVWLATSGGIARYRDGRFDGMGNAGELPSNHVTGFTRGDDGGVSVLTAGDDATAPARQRISPGPDGRPGIAVRDGQGRLWIATRDNGLWLRDHGGYTWTEVLLGGRPLPRYITALFFENDTTLWVGTVTEGAIRLDLGATIDSPRLQGDS